MLFWMTCYFHFFALIVTCRSTATKVFPKAWNSPHLRPAARVNRNSAKCSIEKPTGSDVLFSVNSETALNREAVVEYFKS